MTEQQFGTMPTKKLFFKLAIPSLFSMIFSSIYMIADGIFVGKFIGSDALAAVNLVMPFVLIVFALADMVAVGSSVKISISLGEKDEEKANRLFSASLVFIWILSGIFLLLSIFFLKPLVFTFIKDAVLADLTYRYMRIFSFTLPLIMPMFAVDNYLRICGKAKLSMWINIGVSVLNIFLDALLIGYFRMGIEAAAFSTAFGLSVGSLIALGVLFSKKLTLHFTVPKISFHEIKGIVYNGSSEFFNSIAGSIMTVLVNGMLLHLGGAAGVASYSIIAYIDSVLIAMLYGMLDSIQPAVSYNLGAKQLGRTFSFFKIGIVAAGGISLICMLGMFLFPEILIGMFTQADNHHLFQMSKAALLLFAPSYLFVWLNMIISSFLTSFDKPKESLTIMFCRSIIFPLISLFVFTRFMGVYGVFIVPTINGLCTAVLALCIWQKTTKPMRLALAK